MLVVGTGMQQYLSGKYRMQFNQNGPNVEIQVFVKQLNKKRERVTVEIQQNAIKVEIKNDDLSQVEYLLEEDLYQPIDVAHSKWDVWATQVNIKLRKGDPSIVWPSLAHTEKPVRTELPDSCMGSCNARTRPNRLQQ